jgi:hypothetical protein
MNVAVRCVVSAAIAVVLGCVCARPAAGAETVLYRLFLIDGTTLVSYGEFSRVSDRVVLSIPVGQAAESPDLQLVSIPESAVDWERTDQYSNAVRAQRYGETRGEEDFALLGGRVTEALNLIALTRDPARRLSMALEARGNLARWPSQNFGYRAADVAHLTGMLDEVISELRVAAGQSSFDLSLVATTVSPAVELLPAPDFRGTLEQAFAASAVTPEPAERVSLLRAITNALQEPARRGGWEAALHGRAATELATELRIDKSYRDLSASSIASAAARAARGDVAGVQGLQQSVLKADDRLGRRRPQESAALLALLDLRLDEARRVRLARDASVVRAELFTAYRTGIAPAIAELRRSQRLLENIRELAGPSPRLLPRLEQRLVIAKQRLAAVSPPAELGAAHGLFGAAFQMARRAVSTRRNAVSSRDMKLAWDAASAAAGALMLLDRAAQELDKQASPLRNR